jgi:tetratricopeptide (TPR) repeat protein
VLDALFADFATPAAVEPPAPAVADPFAMAADFLANGLHDRAAAEVSRALARGADQLRGLTLLGVVFARQGAPGEARDRFAAARRIAPDYPDALAGEAQALLDLGRAAEARPLAEALLAARPGDAAALLLAAAARAASGAHAESTAAVAAARATTGPAHAPALRQVGELAARGGDAAAAIAALRAAVAADPHYAAARLDLARLLAGRGEVEEAEAQLVAALDAVPTYADAVLALARLRQRARRLDEGAELLVELLRRDPYHFGALLALGELLLEADGWTTRAWRSHGSSASTRRTPARCTTTAWCWRTAATSGRRWSAGAPLASRPRARGGPPAPHGPRSARRSRPGGRRGSPSGRGRHPTTHRPQWAPGDNHGDRRTAS